MFDWKNSVKTFFCVLILLPNLVFADWEIITYKENVMTLQRDDRGNAIGLICLYDRSTPCQVFVSLKNKCESLNTIPALTSTVKGSYAVSGKCLKLDTKLTAIIFENKQDVFNLVDMLVEENPIGFSFALDDGKFNNLLFNGTGALKALTNVNSLRQNSKN